MRIFLSCQGRVMGAKEYRGAQGSPHSQISRVFEILNCVIVEAGNTNFPSPNTSNLTSVFAFMSVRLDF